jgi:hypothetical protein
MFFLSACAADPQSPQGTPQAIRMSPAPMITSTPTADIIALQQDLFTEREKRIKAEEGVQMKQATISALEDLHVAATITGDANKLLIAQTTERAFNTSVAGTSTSIPITQTAFPVMATIQGQNSKDRAAELKAQADYPKLLNERTAAEAYANTWQYYEALKMFLIFVAGCLGLMLAYRLWAGAVYKIRQLDKLGNDNPAPDPKLSDLLPIPAATPDNVIKCPADILVMLAEGIEYADADGNKKTLAFRQWGRSPVYKYLKDIRDFMTQKQADGKIFAIPAGSFGELDITNDGHGFLHMVIALKAPPAPYTCEDDSPLPHQPDNAQNTPLQPVTGVNNA